MKLSQNITSKQLLTFLGSVLGLFVISLGLASTNTFLLDSKAAQTRAVAVFSIQNKADVVNVDGSEVLTSPDTAWIGTGSNPRASALGLRFTGTPLPADATIRSASVSFTSSKQQWTSINTIWAIEDQFSPMTYDPGTLFSKTVLPTTKLFRDNKRWTADNAYSYDVSELVRAHYAQFGPTDALSIIIRGDGKAWGRRYFYANPAFGPAPTLTIRYATEAPAPTGTPAPPTPQPSATPIQTPVPTIAPTPLPTPEHTTHPSPTPSGTPTSGNPASSMAMGRWTPSKWDTCTQAEHDSYFVVGPDGYRYPTWHPPVHTRSNGTTCTFGHEHGRNPTGYQYWSEIQTHFAYDSNQDGQITQTELSTAGIPFGYVNEQLDRQSLGMMRHEDHVGHKVEFANGEGDIGDGTDPFDSSKTGGVVVPVKNPSGSPKWNQSGVRCYHFHKVHQGVSTPDALTNNIHELVMHTKCISTRSDFPSSTTLLSGMAQFGAAGEFTRFCGTDRTQIVTIGKTTANQNFPGTRGIGMRNIGTRDCVLTSALVPEGQFSSFPYEIWDAILNIRTSTGAVLASQGGGWEVLDAIRYYNPDSANKISYAMDYCYESIGNRKARGGTCDYVTNYGAIRNITWDDPRSGFRGIQRGQYLNQHTINNAGGSEYWYTDSFGQNASRTPFPGSIRQRISPVNAKTNFLSDPRIVLRGHTSGNNTVHAPN